MPMQAYRYGRLAAATWSLLAVVGLFEMDLIDDPGFLVIGLAAVWLLFTVSWLGSSVEAWRTLRKREWLGAGLPLIVITILATTDVTLRLRLYVSDSQLRDLVGAAEAHKLSSKQDSHRAGLFYVYRVDARPGVAFLYTNRAFLSEFGIAYMPGERVDLRGKLKITQHVTGPWYRFERRF